MKLTSCLSLFVSVLLAVCAVAGEPGIDAQSWKITFPLANPRGQALEVRNPEFAGYVSDPDSIPEEHARFFRKEDGVYVFYCEAGRATTENSKYCRTELREMGGKTGGEEYQWTLEKGGTMEVRFKIGSLEGGADKLMFAQIHGHRPESKPLLKCIWDNGYLRLLTKSGEELTDHEEKKRYLPLAKGEWYTCKVVASADEVSVAIDGEVVERFDRSVLGFWPEENTYYFKTGNYLQEKDEGCAATVLISEVSVLHGEEKAQDPARGE
ncbi:MAG: polysaccharide lyase family 7 protein [Luteolibacter sp.]